MPDHEAAVERIAGLTHGQQRRVLELLAAAQREGYVRALERAVRGMRCTCNAKYAAHFDGVDDQVPHCRKHLLLAEAREAT